MKTPLELLENVLIYIEQNIKKNPTAGVLGRTFGLSSIHLQRLFKFAFEQPLGSYIRQRRLTSSLDCLLDTDASILEITLEYGFDYEQSYIRAFKREFGITPGEFRKSGKIVEITPPLQMFDTRKLTNGVILGPVIVMVPKFHIVGKRHKIYRCESLEFAPKTAKHFWFHERNQIEGILDPDVYIGLTRVPYKDFGYTYYQPSVQVKDFTNIPAGYDSDIFISSLCARFRYIGHHHYLDINRDIAGAMYDAMFEFANDDQERYGLNNDSLYFEKINTVSYDGTYCQMEWFTPVFEK